MTRKGRFSMIERYSRPEMAKIWSLEARTDKWLRIEILACEAWAKLGRISQDDLEKIRKARYDLARMVELERETRHDVLAFIRSVAESLGPESRFVHLGLTSSDIVDTALSLQMVEAADLIEKDILGLLAVLEYQARRHKDTLMVGRTHGVHAEPTTFGFKLCLWIDELRRGLKVLREARSEMAVGKISGAVGTHSSAPPDIEEYVCHQLGLKPAAVSSQIIPRERHAFFISALALIASILEGMATEIRSLQRTEILEAEEPFAVDQQGSSAMPHKRNPIHCERICGLARIVRGYASSAMENITLWHERDISHSSAERILIPGSCLLVDYMLNLFTEIMENLVVHPSKMLKNLEASRGLIFSGRVLLALVDKGLDRQEAYHLVQSKAALVWEGETTLFEELQKDPQVKKLLSGEELEALFDYKYYLKYVDAAYQRLGL